MPSVMLTFTTPSTPGGTGAPGGGGGGGTGAPEARAAITKLRISPSSFRAANRGGSLARATHGTGTRVSYRESRPTTTTLTVMRRHGARFVKVGSFRHKDRAGTNSVHFTGRVRHHKLRAGHYLLEVAPGSGARTGRASTKRFQIVP
jgi:hypothetical protein